MMLKVQPCDAGIIWNFKAYYRRRFNRLLLQRLEGNIVDPEEINILGAIQLVVLAWRFDMKPTTITNCFLRCRIRSTLQPMEEVNEDDLLDPAAIQDLQSQIRHFRYCNSMKICNMLNHPDE
eukprot:c47458_g1_i1 orf=858-1223(+)